MVKLKESFEEKEPAYSGRTKCTRLLRVCPYLLNPHPSNRMGVSLLEE
jgi:hypothetical protein